MRAGVQSGARERAVTALARAGALDDQRLAERRAADARGARLGRCGDQIAARGGGAQARRRGDRYRTPFPESERAARLVARTPDRRKAWSLLARRGFDPEVVADAVAPLDEDDPRGLG